MAANHSFADDSDHLVGSAPLLFDAVIEHKQRATDVRVPHLSASTISS